MVPWLPHTQQTLVQIQYPPFLVGGRLNLQTSSGVFKLLAVRTNNLPNVLGSINIHGSVGSTVKAVFVIIQMNNRMRAGHRTLVPPPAAW